jgi:hypothetical protein
MTPSMWSDLKKYIKTKTGHGRVELLGEMVQIEVDHNSLEEQNQKLRTALNAWLDSEIGLPESRTPEFMRLVKMSMDALKDKI